MTARIHEPMTAPRFRPGRMVRVCPYFGVDDPDSDSPEHRIVGVWLRPAVGEDGAVIYPQGWEYELAVVLPGKLSVYGWVTERVLLNNDYDPDEPDDHEPDPRPDVGDPGALVLEIDDE